MFPNRETCARVNAVRDDHPAVAAPFVTDQGAIVIDTRSGIQGNDFAAVTIGINHILIGACIRYWRLVWRGIGSLFHLDIHRIACRRTIVVGHDKCDQVNANRKACSRIFAGGDGNAAVAAPCVTHDRTIAIRTEAAAQVDLLGARVIVVADHLVNTGIGYRCSIRFGYSNDYCITGSGTIVIGHG